MLTVALGGIPAYQRRSLSAASFQKVFIPVTMFVYHFTTSSSLTSGSRELSTTTPSESMNLYVGMAGWVEGRSKESLVVNLLSTAPGKRILPQGQRCFWYGSGIETY